MIYWYFLFLLRKEPSQLKLPLILSNLGYIITSEVTCQTYILIGRLTEQLVAYLWLWKTEKIPYVRHQNLIQCFLYFNLFKSELCRLKKLAKIQFSFSLCLSLSLSVCLSLSMSLSLSVLYYNVRIICLEQIHVERSGHVMISIYLSIYLSI